MGVVEVYAWLIKLCDVKIVGEACIDDAKREFEAVFDALVLRVLFLKRQRPFFVLSVVLFKQSH